MIEKMKQSDLVRFLENLYLEEPAYIWGGNGKLITKPVIDDLIKKYSSETFNDKYYYNKLATSKSKFGFDAPGLLNYITGEDKTVLQYFKSCVIKRHISSMPDDKVCLVFNKSLTHVGIYLGNGYTIEMKDSKINMMKEYFRINRWTYFGMPDFIDYDENITKINFAKYDRVIKNYQVFLNTEISYIKTPITGEFDIATKENSIRLLQKVFSDNYGCEITETGVFDSITKNNCPNHKLLLRDKNALRKIIYVVNTLLYSVIDYKMADTLDGDVFDKRYTPFLKGILAQYQSIQRGLEVNGELTPETLQSLFK